MNYLNLRDWGYLQDLNMRSKKNLNHGRLMKFRRCQMNRLKRHINKYKNYRIIAKLTKIRFVT